MLKTWEKYVKTGKCSLFEEWAAYTGVTEKDFLDGLTGSLRILGTISLHRESLPESSCVLWMVGYTITVGFITMMAVLKILFHLKAQA